MAALEIAVGTENASVENGGSRDSSRESSAEPRSQVNRQRRGSNLSSRAQSFRSSPGQVLALGLRARGKTDSVRSTTLHTDDDITQHVFSNAAQHRNPDAARLKVANSYQTARKISKGAEEQGEQRERGHAVFGPGANIKSANEFVEEPPVLEAIVRYSNPKLPILHPRI
jgi:hypothetical protein